MLQKFDSNSQINFIQIDHQQYHNFNKNNFDSIKFNSLNNDYEMNQCLSKVKYETFDTKNIEQKYSHDKALSFKVLDSIIMNNPTRKYESNLLNDKKQYELNEIFDKIFYNNEILKLKIQDDYYQMRKLMIQQFYCNYKLFPQIIKKEYYKLKTDFQCLIEYMSIDTRNKIQYMNQIMQVLLRKQTRELYYLRFKIMNQEMNEYYQSMKQRQFIHRVIQLDQQETRIINQDDEHLNHRQNAIHQFLNELKRKDQSQEQQQERQKNREEFNEKYNEYEQEMKRIQLQRLKQYQFERELFYSKIEDNRLYYQNNDRPIDYNNDNNNSQLKNLIFGIAGVAISCFIGIKYSKKSLNYFKQTKYHQVIFDFIKKQRNQKQQE